jgi:hypothetical protein
MAHFSVEIVRLIGSVLGGNQQTNYTKCSDDRKSIRLEVCPWVDICQCILCVDSDDCRAASRILQPVLIPVAIVKKFR